jgi:hypothetical protein
MHKNVGTRKEGNFGRDKFRALTQGWRLPAGRSPQSERLHASPLPPPLFPIFLVFKFFFGFMRKFENGLGILAEWCTTLPFLEPFPYTWKGEIFHSSWSLEISFLSKLFLRKLEYTRTFISIVGIFV